MDYDKMLRYAFKLSKNRQDAEDLVHDAWLAARINNKHDLPEYITTSIKNKYINKLNKYTVRDANIDNIKLVLYTKNENFYTNTLEDAVAQAQFLPSTKKLVFDLLKSHPNMTHEELAKKINMGRRQFSHRVQAMRNSLNKLIKQGYIRKYPPKPLPQKKPRLKLIVPKKCKEVVCLETGVVYKDSSAVAKEFNLSISSLCHALKYGYGCGKDKLHFRRLCE